MTTFTLTLDENIKFDKTHFNNSLELLEELSDKLGIRTSWSVPESSLSKKDHLLIQQAKDSSWENLDNI